MPPVLSKPRHSTRLDREPIDEELGLSFPLEEFRRSEAPRNHEVLERLIFILTTRSGLQKGIEDAAKMVAGEILDCWRGSNIETSHRLTLFKKVTAIDLELSNLIRKAPVLESDLIGIFRSRS